MALDLAAGRAREVFESDEADLARPLIAGQLIAAKPHQLVGIGAVDVPCHEGHRAFAPAQVPGLYDGGIDHLRMRQQHPLDLGRIDVLAVHGERLL